VVENSLKKNHFLNTCYTLFASLMFVGALLISEKTLAGDESQFAEKARLRQYPGGADESDLKVQAHLVISAKNKNNDMVEDSSEGF